MCSYFLDFFLVNVKSFITFFYQCDIFMAKYTLKIKTVISRPFIPDT